MHDFEKLPFDSEFNIAVIYDCLHHADDEKQVLVSVWRALQPGGEVIIVEPGRRHHLSVTAQWAVGTHGVNEKEMPPAVTRRLLAGIGFKDIRVIPRARFQAYERTPSGRIAESLSRIFGVRFASFVKTIKNSLFPYGNGIVLAHKPK